MSLTTISNINLAKEREIQDKINKYISSNESLVFDSGAGSGKTYALAESIKHTMKQFGVILEDRGQKIICITYTNVATNELKERLNHSDLVLVSTIHERLWDLINKYQPQLLDVHVERINEELTNLNVKVKTEKYKKFNELTEKQHNKFFECIADNRDTFYKSYNYNAKEFRTTISTLIGDFQDLLSNVDIFKKYVSALFSIKSLERCLKHIEEKKEGYTRVEYTAKYNNDRLYKMQFSHDTLLVYANKLISRYPQLNQIIFDKYPYVFVDEYQDTNPLVVKMLATIEKSALKYGHSFFVGYFGDTSQNIYEAGVGGNLNSIHTGLKSVKKNFNRRSTSEVIDITNKIRSDNIVQQSIYDDCAGGCVDFYYGSQNDIPSFIEKCKVDWNIKEKGTIDCLLLRNEDVATQTGFSDLYKTIKKMPKYKKGKGYEQINTELLSNDLSKLWYVQRTLFELINLYVLVKESTTKITEIIPKDSLGKMNMQELRGLVSKLRRIEGKSFGEYVDKLVGFYQTLKKISHKRIIENLFPEEQVKVENIRQLIIDGLISPSEIGIDEVNALVDELLKVSMDEFVNWHGLLTDKRNSEIIYHTYHGTKGLEFENVIIVLENKFGRINNYFERYFVNYSVHESLKDEEKENYLKTRNLLYVSCSRAVSNLRIFFVDDITSVEEGIKNIFGSIKTF